MTQLLQTLVNAAGLTALYMTVAVGLTLMFGVLRIVNFAQGDFMTVAAYLGVTLAGVGIAAASTLLVLLPALAVVGLAFYAVVLRPTEGRSHETRLLATFGASFFLQGAIQAVWGVNPVAARSSAEAVALGGVVLPVDLLRNVVVAAVAVGALAAFVHRTRLGREIRATAQDPVGAEVLGIRTGRAKVVATVLAAALTSTAGLMLFTTSPVVPTSGFGYLLFAFAVVILGGVGSIAGAVLASVVLALATSFVTTYGPTGVAPAVAFVTILVALLVRPSGLVARAT